MNRLKECPLCGRLFCIKVCLCIQERNKEHLKIKAEECAPPYYKKLPPARTREELIIMGVERRHTVPHTAENCLVCQRANITGSHAGKGADNLRRFSNAINPVNIIIDMIAWHGLADK